jgi:methylated-DNA-[protein]-cysteine S-methyltransferase
MTSIAPSLIRLLSPIGRLELTADPDCILSLSIERDGRLPLEESPESPSTLLERASTELAEYFAGIRTDFDLPVRLTGGTVFQQSVWRRLAGLRFGEVVSYGELGASIGRPGSGRAIGGAVGANPIPILVGCHRVLAADGRITGYSGGNGIPTKVWLLDHEGIAHAGSVPAGTEPAGIGQDA